MLVSYGLGLRDLTPEQVSTLSALLQLIQSSGEQGVGTGLGGAGVRVPAGLLVLGVGGVASSWD